MNDVELLAQNKILKEEVAMLNNIIRGDGSLESISKNHSPNGIDRKERMKLKDLVKLPEAKSHARHYHQQCDCGADGFNMAISEIGEIEVPQIQKLDEKEVYKTIARVKQIGMVKHYQLGHEWCDLIAKSICQKFSPSVRVVPLIKDIMNILNPRLHGYASDIDQLELASAIRELFLRGEV